MYGLGKCMNMNALDELQSSSGPNRHYRVLVSGPVQFWQVKITTDNERPTGGTHTGKTLCNRRQVPVCIWRTVTHSQKSGTVVADLHHQQFSRSRLQVPSPCRVQLGPDRARDASAVRGTVPSKPGVLVPPQLQLGVGDVDGQLYYM